MPNLLSEGEKIKKDFFVNIQVKFFWSFLFWLFKKILFKNLLLNYE